MAGAGAPPEELRASHLSSRVPTDILDSSATVRTKRPFTSKIASRMGDGEPSVRRKTTSRLGPFREGGVMRSPTKSGLMDGAVADPGSTQSIPRTYVFG